MVRIAAVGDIHIREQSRGTLRPHWEGLAAHADVLLLAGDLTDIGTPEQVRVLVEELRELPVPVVAVLGNHDRHAGDVPFLRGALELAGITVLDGEATTLRIGGRTLGIAGAKGFGGGFRGRSAHKFGEFAMKAYVEATEQEALRLRSALAALDTDWRVALTHYAPVKDTLAGEPLELYAYLGAWQLGQAIEQGRAHLALHGHAHYGSAAGATGSGIPVRNVALPLIRKPYALFRLDDAGILVE